MVRADPIDKTLAFTDAMKTDVKGFLRLAAEAPVTQPSVVGQAIRLFNVMHASAGTRP